MTYSVAIASPLPEIRFPVANGRFVTISPFAKSVTGYNIDPTRFAPTNQIVDYYVDRIANTGAADQNASINGGARMRSSASTTRTWSRAPTTTWMPSRAIPSRCRRTAT
jgi:hypothetical protein